ncbi:hypothetical protein D3C73_1058400 [compost metagenome]
MQLDLLLAVMRKQPCSLSLVFGMSVEKAHTPITRRVNDGLRGPLQQQETFEIKGIRAIFNRGGGDEIAVGTLQYQRTVFPVAAPFLLMRPQGGIVGAVEGWAQGR